MRARKFLLLAVVVGTLGSLGCQPEPIAEPTLISRPSWTEYTPQPNEVYLRRELPPSFADDTSTLTVDFPIRNETAAVVSFSGVRKSCGCSDAELGKTTLVPGEETNLRVAVRTPGRFGPQRITCFVDESTGKTWVCDLHTTIHQRLRFDPFVTHFGLIRPRTDHTRKVVFLACAVSEADLPARVTFACDSPRVQVGEARVVIERPATGVVVKRWTVPVTLRAPSTFGPESATLTADTGTREAVPPRTTLDWHVPETFVVSPRQVFFSANELKAGGSKQVLIRRRDGERMAPLTTKSPHPAVTVEAAADTDLTTLTVKFDGSTSGEFVHGELVLTTGDADQPTVRIPVAVGR